MQLGIRLHDTKPFTLEERLNITKQQGFTCAHVALSKVIKEFPIEDATLTPGYAMYLKKLFQKNEIDIAVLGCYLNLAHPEPAKLKNIKDTYLAHIRFASVLGCGVVGTETGEPNAMYEFEPASQSKEALQLFITNLRPIIAYAEAMGVIVAIEPVRTHIVSTPQRAKRVLEECNSPNLQIIFDPVNLLEMDNYRQQTEVLQEAIDLLGKDIAVVHMKDFIIKDNALISVAAGSGELDYEPIMQFIKAKKPYIHCTLEDTTPDNAVKAKEYIEDLWKKVSMGPEHQ
jgi:sugar phosphate isomerase/epimerase